jgi:transcriptional regulator
MYIPHYFREDQLPVLHTMIEEAGLATLVTSTAEGLVATHLPLLLERSLGPSGTLSGHIARANPQWKDYSPESQALAIFLGPQAYISPNWYATTRQTGKVVPTWNYVAVHAYGKVRFFEDQARLRKIVTELTARYESGFPRPWRVEDAPADYIEGALKAIIGFDMEIQRIEGKWKMNQNHPLENRQGVIAGLRERAEPSGLDLAAMMENRESRKDP